MLRPATDDELLKLLKASRKAVADAEAAGEFLIADQARERSDRYFDEWVQRMRSCAACQDPNRCCPAHRTHVKDPAPHRDCILR